MQKRAHPWTALLAVVVVGTAAVGCTRPPNGMVQGFRAEVVASGLELPTSFVMLSADDAYISEKAGVVRVLRDGQLLATPLIDLRNRVNDLGDAGLNAIVLDPDFAQNGHLYLAYAYEDPNLPPGNRGQTQRVTRVTVQSDVAAPASEAVILGTATGPACYDHWRTDSCIPLNGAHTIDDLAFDVTGHLLVSVGDGAWTDGDSTMNQRAQDPQVLAGKILRIHKVTGMGLPDNPYAMFPLHMNVARVYAHGLRNPFRFTQRPGTRELFVGDVGEETFEEINLVRPGANYGWPCFEGNERRATPLNQTFCDVEIYKKVDEGDLTVTAPVSVYRHTTNAGGSIVGGVFYTGDRYPEEYRGDYFYADYSMEFIRRQQFAPDGTAVGPAVQFADATGAGAPVMFRNGPDGNLWYLSIYPAELRRVVFDGEGSVPASCADGEYRVEYFNNPDLAGTAANVRCEGPIEKRLYDASPAPGIQTDNWSFRATSRFKLAGGTYQFKAYTNDGKRIWVDGQPIFDHWADSDTPTSVSVEFAQVRLAAGTHTVVMEYFDRTDDAIAILERTRLGTPPVVQVVAPADLTQAVPGSAVAFAAMANDAEDGTIDPAAIRVDVTMLHFGGTEPHSHPHATDLPNPGTVVVSDAHGAGNVMFEIRARATDSSGITTVSDPVRVCLTGGAVGACT
jgi:glucose/arabinose dehydrogenase